MKYRRCVMKFARRPESPDYQERREAFREQAAAPNVTVLNCRIPSELHRRLRHLVVDEDPSVTATVIEMLEEGLQRRGR
jgi:predicted HicB family RNase H-like nuclease